MIFRAVIASVVVLGAIALVLGECWRERERQRREAADEFAAKIDAIVEEWQRALAGIGTMMTPAMQSVAGAAAEIAQSFAEMGPAFDAFGRAYADAFAEAMTRDGSL